MKSKHIHKTVSAQESKLLQLFLEKQLEWFYQDDAYKAFPDLEKSTVRGLLKRMVDKGLITKFGCELFWIVPFELNSKSYLPNWHLIAAPLIRNGEYYIGYYSALQIHGLITQPSLSEQIVCNKSNSKNYNFAGVNFKIIRHNDNHFFGYKSIWIDQYNKVQCSDLEKTFIDCLFKTEYAGGVFEVSKAIWMAKDRIDYQKMLIYAKKFNCQSVIKRLGYILEFLNIGKEITPELLKLKSESVCSLDTESNDFGKIVSKWSVKVNVDMDNIKNAIIN